MTSLQIMKLHLHTYSILVLSLLMLAGCRSKGVLPVLNQQSYERSIVVLFENDVHCAVDGYPLLAGLRNAVSDTAWVQVVSSGDYIQGGTIGAISKGDYIIDVMNRVKYDAVTFGNHEFDFRSQRLFELMQKFNGGITCSNFVDKKSGETVFADFVMTQAGSKKIAYVGVVTPSVLTSMPTAFFSEDGTQNYDLLPTEVALRVQTAADRAREAGADYVIVLSHLSESSTATLFTSHSLVASTRGIDAVLDGHSHSVVPMTMVQNLDGKPVPVAQTGTLFANVGHLLITPDGRISTRLVPTSELTERDPEVQHVVDSIKSVAETFTNSIVGHSDVDLLLKDHRGIEVSRMRETNTANLVTDAFRIVCGTDVAMLNAGAIRLPLLAGDLTYGQLISLLPYDNQMCVAEVTGQQLLDALQKNTVKLPYPDGQFPVVSGLQYTVDALSHKVSNVNVLNQQTGKYEPLQLEKTYTLASTDYAIVNGGFRNAFKDAKVLRNGFMHYCDCFVEYFQKHLGSHITSQYAQPEGRITVIGLEELLQQYINTH